MYRQRSRSKAPSAGPFGACETRAEAEAPRARSAFGLLCAYSLVVHPPGVRAHETGEPEQIALPREFGSMRQEQPAALKGRGNNLLSVPDVGGVVSRTSR